MSNGIRDIRRRIRSVRSTSQITRAMQMVAASKMRKAQQAALVGRPMADEIFELLTQAVLHAGGFHHPLSETRPVHTRAVIVVGTDRGLCGGLNSNLLREALKFDPETTVYIAVGRKAAQLLVRVRRRVIAEFTYNDMPKFVDARAVSRFAQELFLNGGVDEIEVLFTDFHSTLVQQASLMHFLPVGEVRRPTVGIHGSRIQKTLEAPGVSLCDNCDFLFEPDVEQVLNQLLPQSLNFELFQVMMEARASEHSARMVAMKNATDNASNLIQTLTLEYNKMRQASITNELLEISSAVMAASGA